MIRHRLRSATKQIEQLFIDRVDFYSATTTFDAFGVPSVTFSLQLAAVPALVQIPAADQRRRERAGRNLAEQPTVEVEEADVLVHPSLEIDPDWYVGIGTERWSIVYIRTTDLVQRIRVERTRRVAANR
ncbi:MAG: hypothetical protein KatS3mg109_2154 [Pirellulaceae bacterium]|nr:MAG: hypothetical protein KatS3mg109_2154 [Pirellulaceae bacterium]